MHAADPGTASPVGQATKASPRVVVFLTEASHESMPQAAHGPACLLPMAWTSFAERVMQSCALAGIRHIDVVACDHLEVLRHELGLGERWGLSLAWHLVKDGHAPYGVLRQLAAGTQRLLVGHAHCWIDTAALAEMLREDCTAVQLEPTLAWTGWASLPAAKASLVSPHADLQALTDQLLGASDLPQVALSSGQHLRTGDAQSMLHIQARCLHPQQLHAAPSSWLHMPWGLRSADAHIHSACAITGPVVIGPGCLLEEGASIGPNTVLFGDVMVARGAAVEGSLILKNTYIGEDVSVRNSVVQSGVAHHVDWGVMHQLPGADAVLAPLHQDHGAAQAASARSLLQAHLARLAGRTAAVAAALLGAPMLLAAMACSRLQGGTGLWERFNAVSGWQADGSLRITPVRQRSGAASAAAAFIGFFGGVLDVAQGRRAWFGVRPRGLGDWYALNREWQRLLAKTPIGVMHAPAWSGGEGEANCAEALAVADAYFAASRRLRSGP